MVTSLPLRIEPARLPIVFDPDRPDPTRKALLLVIERYRPSGSRNISEDPRLRSREWGTDQFDWGPREAAALRPFAHRRIADIPDCPTLHRIEDHFDTIWVGATAETITRGILSRMLDSFPNARPQSPETYLDAAVDVLTEEHGNPPYTGFSPSVVASAAREALRTLKFCPAISELYDLCTEARASFRHVASNISHLVQLRSDAELVLIELGERPLPGADLDDSIAAIEVIAGEPHADANRSRRATPAVSGSLPAAPIAGTLHPGISRGDGDFPGAPYLPATMGTAQLADLLGLSDRTVRELAARDVLPRTGRGRFDTRLAVRRYTAHLREQAAGRGNGDSAAMGAVTAERLREARERADKIALQNAKARGEMVPAADVERAWSEVLRDIRARMLAVPARCMARLGRLTAAEGQIIEQEVRDALKGAADAD